MNISDLGGHSGCRILLYEIEDNNVFVRKIARDLDYNERLIVQADKQRQYKSTTIKTPMILKAGYTEDGLYYFDMEYIHGITLAEYMKTIEIGKVRGIVETIVNNIVDSEHDAADVDENKFMDKIESLELCLSAQNNQIINQALSLLKAHSWKKFIKTSCHGDLTLENIIVKDNQLYLIDFLDSFYDCWIMDISTLMQDVQTLWSYRMQDEININTLLRLIVFRDILMDNVEEQVGQDTVEIYYALLLKLIRIYPYTKDSRTYEFLNEKIKSIINIIREIS
jgi:hypothetical protein